jgi:hypothetical protein
VKEARDEAKKEIEAYRAEKEAEFKKFEAEVLALDPEDARWTLTVLALPRKQGSRGGSGQGGRSQDQRD